MYILETIFDCYFYIDLVLSFFTAYYEATELEDRFVTDLPSIAKNYFKTWFTIDVAACLPIDLALRLAEGSFLCSFNPNDKQCGKPAPVAGGGAGEEDSSQGGGQALRLLKLFRIFRLLRLLR